VDGETGLLVPPSDPESLTDALNILVRDADLAASMGKAGRARAAADFGWSTIAAQTAALYQELTATH